MENFVFNAVNDPSGPDMVIGGTYLVKCPGFCVGGVAIATWTPDGWSYFGTSSDIAKHVEGFVLLSQLTTAHVPQDAYAVLTKEQYTELIERQLEFVDISWAMEDIGKHMVDGATCGFALGKLHLKMQKNIENLGGLIQGIKDKRL